MEKLNLVEEIIDKMPSNLETDLEKAYYVYIETCKIFTYDTSYLNSPLLVKLFILNDNQNIKNIKHKDVICSTWSYIYMNLLKQLKIDSKLIKRRGHYWVEFKSGDDIMYCDPTYGRYTDLSRIKHNSMPCHFFSVLPEKTDALPIRNPAFKLEETLIELNKKVGYEVKEDDILTEIEKNIDNYDGALNKIKYILSKLDLTGHDLASDFEYFVNVTARYLKEDKDNVIYNDLTKVNDDLSFDIIKLITVKDNNRYHYYLFRSMDNIKKVNDLNLLEYSLAGYGINNYRYDIGFKYPLEFISPVSSLPYFLNKISFKNKSIEKNKSR